ncbi:MAG: NAD+ synthase, partial [Halobacteriaceae archaeon]
QNHILTFITETVDAAGADKTVLGISGGIDSTLVSYLAVEAVSEDRVHGLILPGKGSTEENMNDAEQLAQNLGISYDIWEINSVTNELLKLYSEAKNDKVAVGNARARVRGVLNYLVANHENAIVLGTGNRTEYLLGYFTKYGDQAVDCNPIGNLYKQQVRQLARHMGVDEHLVTKTPAAELWEDHTDEAEIGIDYDTIDAILALHIDSHVSKTATANTLDISEETIERVREMYEQSQHKRSMPPAPEPLF